LNIQARFASIGEMICALAASEMVGVFACDTGSSMASEFGVTDEPMIAST